MSHAEAEQLISARLDAPLDPTQNRVLLAHLAMCNSCRAFASSMEAMSSDLRSLPMLPASPLVSRQVRTRIAQQPSPWSWLTGALFNGRWGAVPAAVAGVALVAIVAVALILRGNNADQGVSSFAAPNTTHLAIASQTTNAATTAAATPDNGNAAQIASISSTPKFPNVQITYTATATNTAAPVSTATPTAKPKPTETATRVPVAIVMPSATTTAVATSTPMPSQSGTATSQPKATATATATSTSSATSTPVPTIAPTETTTVLPTQVPTETASPEPTQTPADTSTPEPTLTPLPTKTAKSTETPTEQATTVVMPATPIAEPTKTATKKPAKTPKPAPTPTSTPEVAPTIAPQGGQTSQIVDTPPADVTVNATDAAGQTPADASGNSKIQAIGTSINAPTETPAAAAPTGPAAIVEISPTKVAKPSHTATATNGKGSDGSAIGQAPQVAQMPNPIESGAVIRANASGKLFVVEDSAGCTVYDFSGNVVGTIPGAKQPFWSTGGTALLIAAPGDAGSVAKIWVSDSQVSFAINAPSDRPFVDRTAGADGDSFYFVREFSDKQGGIEVHRTLLSGNNPDSVIWKGKDRLAGDPVVTDAGVIFASGGSFWTVTPDGNGVQAGSDPYGDVRAPLRSPGGGGFVFMSGGNIIATAASHPGAGNSIPYSTNAGGGFVYSTDGSEIAVAVGDKLSIYTIDGVLEGHLASSNGASISVAAWTSDGIYVVENGAQPVLRLVGPSVVKTGG